MRCVVTAVRENPNMGRNSPATNRPTSPAPAPRPGSGTPGTAGRVPGPLGTGKTPLAAVHPQAPAARYAAPVAAAAATKAPPTTVVGTTSIKVESTAIADVDVSVEVLADGADPTITGAKTSADSTGVVGTSPGYTARRKKKVEVVDKLAGPYQLKGKITIQTVYGSGATPSQTSLYGRGTTPKDLVDGNTSLGFHEFCHREDYLSYLKTKPLPAFGGKTGMTVAAYRRAQTAFRTALVKYFNEMGAASNRNTDEVGYQKTRCIRDGKCR